MFFSKQEQVVPGGAEKVNVKLKRPKRTGLREARFHTKDHFPEADALG